MKSLIASLASLRPRKFHAYCLGAAKTGTTSIAHMVMPVARSAHEPETPSTTKLVIDYLAGNISEVQALKEVKTRDKRLNLEFESSHPLGYFAPQLVALFPDARFLVTVREPSAWLASRISFHAQRQPEEWQAYRDFIWRRHHTHFEPVEKVLEQNNLYSLDGYLAQYSEQYRVLFESLNKAQTYVLRTEEISAKAPEIAEFLGVDANKIEPVHTNKIEKSESILNRLDSKFVEQKIEQHCGWLRRRFW